jgi:hypothetical protein
MAAALLTPSLHGELDMLSLNGSMEDAISMLQSYAQKRSAAKRCLVTLTSILQSPYTQRTEEENAGPALDPSFARPRQHAFLLDFATEQNGQALNNAGWLLNADDPQNAAVFGHFSDTWLTQPPMDSFNSLGI